MVGSAKGYIGITDPDWHTFLSGQPQVDEVNFWQPHGNRAFNALTRGEPFFFKLHAPLKQIAGFGFFERFEFLPAWLAWEAFGVMNGAPNFEAMIDRLVRLRGTASDVDASGDFQIGCVMLAAPVFFGKDRWVKPPVDWAKTGIQQGKSYGLDSGEGQRILRECIARARTQYWNIEEAPDLVANGVERYGAAAVVKPRLGQGLFRFAVRDAYDGACAVTGEHSRPVLEAAHIRPYARGGQHRVSNGLLLRSDLHRLYDCGYVTVTPDYVFRVGEKLRQEFDNGRSYYGLDGSPIRLPASVALKPKQELLEWHQRTVYKG